MTVVLPDSWRELPPEAKERLRDRLAERIEQRRRDAWQPYPWQVPPAEPGAQGLWLMLGGRGTGKTDGAARYVNEHVRGPACDPRLPGGHRLSIIAPTQGDAVESCVNGPSGLRAHNPAVRLLTRQGGTFVLWPSGAEAKVFGAHTPQDVERLRAGGNRCLVWLEELAAMRYLGEALSHSRFGLRLGPRPHFVGSTTPKPLPELRKLLKDHRTITTRGRTSEAIHLDPAVRAELYADYAGTRLGRQELEGELLDDVEGALWRLADFDEDGMRLPASVLPDLARVVVAVDPAVSSGATSDSTGLAVCGRDYGREPGGEASWDGPARGSTRELDQRPHGYVLHSERLREQPEPSMRRAVELYHRYRADSIVVEANNGGDYLPAVLRQIDPTVPVKTVHATRGKKTRAEPVAALYAEGQRRIHHVGKPGAHAELEDEMTTWTDAPGDPSPDVLDALVWGLTELFISGTREAHRAQPRDMRLRGRR